MSLCPRWLYAAVCAATTIVAAFPACAALKMTKVSQVTRPSGYNFTYGAQQISGVTYAGNNLFYAIDDTDNKLYPLVFAITGVRILDDGRLELAFNGVREDLGEAARDELYPVYRMETIGGDESPVGGTTEIVELDGVKRTVWTSDEPVDETHGFYRVEVDSRR